MNFFIDRLLLWLKNGDLRELQFHNDKVNVITGNSKTGKTAILEIIDYCLCGSSDSVVISHEHIGENVTWYGLKFYINDKTYTIARGGITEGGKFSSDYFFSQTGEIPHEPIAKLGENEIKSILDFEFSIDSELMLSQGGRSIKKNTKLSYRYFLMLNTISKDVIDNGKMFFDKLTIERYMDVWPQIFDLALGVIDLQHIATLMRINDLQQEIVSLESEKKKQEKKSERIKENKEMIVKRAKESGLLDESLDLNESFKMLELMINSGLDNLAIDFSTEQEYEKLEFEREKISLQLAKFRRFKKSYNEYKDSLRADEDSLLPIDYITKRFSHNVQGEYRQFLNMLSKELDNVRKAIDGKRPFEYDVDRKVRELKSTLAQLDDKLSRTARVNYTQIPSAQKLVSFGEIKSEYNHFDFNAESSLITDKQIADKVQELEKHEAEYSSTEDRRGLVINTLNEYIQTYIGLSKVALDEYGKYCAWFDYKKRILTLKKNKSASTAKISSSSDHLFMHLCLFAGMHNMILMDSVPYVPSFLIMDQPSRPYFNTNEYDLEDSETAISNKSDWSKVKNIFRLWDGFFENILESAKHFQVIMLEHVSENAWTNCKHVHLVEIFDGIINALIPPPKSLSNTEKKS